LELVRRVLSNTAMRECDETSDSYLVARWRDVGRVLMRLSPMLFFAILESVEISTVVIAERFDKQDASR
jgi:hypothetical protein